MAEPAGKLPENILYFARLLRAAGLPVGSGQVLDAISAVQIVGLNGQQDLHDALLPIFVNRYEQIELFEQAFYVFWQNPKLMERMMSAMLPTIKTPEADQEEILRRLGDALGKNEQSLEQEAEEQIEFDARLSYSQQEIIQQKDFEQMSAEEIAEAKKLIAQMRLPIQQLKTRRFSKQNNGDQIDMRRTLRSALRSRDSIPLQFKQRKTRNPSLVVLCDISGSMSQYSRMFLHFMHAVTNDRDRVHSFLFGTRLTNISRYLHHRDVDVALEKTSKAVLDWSGGTRIGACLGQFNRQWSRRVLSQGAVVLIISDGLDRDEGSGLQQEMTRLSLSCRRLVWLNPLLRYDEFQPKAQGIKAMLPYVDDFLPAHNLNSLASLVQALSGADQQRAA